MRIIEFKDQKTVKQKMGEQFTPRRLSKSKRLEIKLATSLMMNKHKGVDFVKTKTFYTLIRIFNKVKGI
jgi:hypothetical protein